MGTKLEDRDSELGQIKNFGFWLWWWQVNVTADHRIIYGADLSAFLQTFAKIVENPDSLTLQTPPIMKIKHLTSMLRLFLVLFFFGVSVHLSCCVCIFFYFFCVLFFPGIIILGITQISSGLNGNQNRPFKNAAHEAFWLIVLEFNAFTFIFTRVISQIVNLSNF